MTQESVITLSVEDDQIVTNNQFGVPLAIYKRKQSCTKRLQWICLILFGMSLAMLIVHFMSNVSTWYEIFVDRNNAAYKYFHDLVSQNFFDFNNLQVLFVFFSFRCLCGTPGALTFHEPDIVG